MDIETCFKLRRDTRHFTADEVPNSVLEVAFAAAHCAPSVGLSQPWRFVVVRSKSLREKLYESFVESRTLAEDQVADEAKKQLHKSLKLEAFTSSPLGVAVFCEEPPADEYTIGAIGTRETFRWSCACAIQNFWLSLTSQGFGAGWVSILNLAKTNELLQVPAHWLPMGYLCVGKPQTDYDRAPMLEQLQWKTRERFPQIFER